MDLFDEAAAMTDSPPIETPVAPVLPVQKAECSECGGPRNCEIRGRHKVNYEDGLFWGQTTWFILECRGCEHVFVQTVSVNSEDQDQWYDEYDRPCSSYIETLRYWPARSKRKRPEWMGEYDIDELDAPELHSALRELYSALDNDLNMLAAIGVRTCVDIASELLHVDPALTFKEKLDSLVAGKHIRELDRQRLAAAIEVGSATAHRKWKPTAADLDTMVTVLEEFVFDAFVQPHRRKLLDEKAAKVQGTVPPKPDKKKKAALSSPPKNANTSPASA